MPALITSKINISVNGEEKEIIITGKHVREFYGKNKLSLFQPMEWIDDDGAVFDVIDVLGIDADNISFDEIGNLKAELILMAENTDNIVQKKILPTLEIRQKNQMKQQTELAEMITAILQKSSIQTLSESPVIPDTQ
jgi:hypothetical protein